MFSYVAKSLLSKTLRTFLRKYLENIELESIDYGSSTASAGTKQEKSAKDGGASGSGWGVRLSNVKLREGMELMKLPGKRKRVVSRKRKVRRNTRDENSAENESTPVTRNSKRELQVEGGEELFITQLKDSLGERDDAGAAPVCENHLADTTLFIGGEMGGIIVQPEVTLPLHDEQQSSDTENGYFSSSPSTPTQTSTGICGVPSTFCLNSNSRRTVESQEESAASELPLLSDGHQLSNMPIVDGRGESHDTEKTANGNENLGQKEPPPLTSMPSRASSGERIMQHNLTGKTCDVDDEDDSYVDVEEEFVVEDDMALVVGAGGAIGTLNIRLVGKELHVTVEDAHLIVEAVPSESISDGGNEITKNPQLTKPNLDRSTSSSSEADLPSLVDEDEDATTMGEKIKKKSMLARWLSMIPHLFLRDCRVSLILPEEMGDDELSSDSCDDCTIFELGIDFLTVTSGDDFLDVLGFDTGNQSSGGASTPKSQLFGFRRSSSQPSGASPSNSERKHLNSQSIENNIFSRKRIRTGKGPDGGVWLKIHPPRGKRIEPPRARHHTEPIWARQNFLDASESFFLRFSGLDIHARMLVDIIKEHDDDEIGNVWSSNAYEDYTMDSMLFGVDYVDPISLTRHQIRKEIGSMPPVDELSRVMSDTDSNGIQSVPFASNIHWIAQKAHCSDCKNSHLPLNDCFDCWDSCVQKKSTSLSSMDNLMPLPGFVFHLSMTDSFDVNVDRSSLEALGYLKALLTSKKPPTDEVQENAQNETDANITTTDLDKGDEAPSNVPSWSFGDKSFPPFMQPDTIYLSGVYVSKLTVRIEAIQPQRNSGLKFHFWQFVGQSIQLEETQVDAEEQFLRDAIFHVGGIQCKDFTGVCQKNLLVAGIDDVGTMPKEPRGSEVEVRLPCTASRVLGVHSPTIVDKQPNKSYAVHTRLIQSHVPKDAGGKDSVSASNVGYVNLRMGAVDVDVNNILLSDISKTFSQTRSIFSSGLEKANQSGAKKNKQRSQGSSKWLYQVSTVGGTLSYQPRIKMKIPESKVQLRSGSGGLSFETFLQRLGIEYGPYSFEKPMAPSIIPLCSLPESSRMNILLYLDDLTSLEKLFNIKKKQSSAFLRCHAVSKKLSKMGASSAKQKMSSQTEANRRRNALARLQLLDIDSLEALLARHDRSHEKE
mmetsp:Transcript_39976/g.96200  ORF Transcript_39976/g.96200 Transcript_39976/m.96200 type:complete len:1166 (+) Transcript_39976:187-3684(+)